MIVQHPFTNSGIVMLRNYGNGECVNIVEDQTAQDEWRKQIRGLIDNADDVYSIFVLVNKPYKMTFLKYCTPYLSRSEFSQLLSEAWTRSENPNSDPNFTPDELLFMFKLADKETLMSEEDYRGYEALPQTITVYRGVTDINADNPNALSWTTDRSVAEWFATRFGEHGRVYEAEIDKKHIFAYFGGGDESEVVLDPKHLSDITQTEPMDDSMGMNL